MRHLEDKEVKTFVALITVCMQAFSLCFFSVNIILKYFRVLSGLLPSKVYLTDFSSMNIDMTSIFFCIIIVKTTLVLEFFKGVLFGG